MDHELRPVEEREYERFLTTTEAAFGWQLRTEDLDKYKRVLEPERTLAAFDGDAIVGTAGAYSFQLTVPGGEVRAAGVTMVGVLPSHTRRGILAAMMRSQLDDFHRRGEPVAILWASEGAIYDRYGYGLASRYGRLSIERTHATFRDDKPTAGLWRLVDLKDAAKVLPQVYEQVRVETPGMFARSGVWWEAHTLPDPEHERDGAGPMFCAIYEVDGRAEGYALYRIKGSWEDGVPNNSVWVREAIGTSPDATREVWRFLFNIDLSARIQAWFLPAEHPLFLMVKEPRRLRFAESDALWLRIVDLAGALQARRYDQDGALVLEVTDEHCPWNQGRWKLIADSGVGSLVQTEEAADLSLDIWDLGTVYLGGFTFAQLVQAGRLDVTPDAIARADRMFRCDKSPWCPEIF